MSGKVKSIGYELQKAINLGLIDNWLRGMTFIVPSLASQDYEDESEDALPPFNKHVLSYGAYDVITEKDITSMAGFTALTALCKKKNLGFTVALLPEGHILLEFDPQSAFKQSKVFGTDYSNVIPHNFRARQNYTA